MLVHAHGPIFKTIYLIITFYNILRVCYCLELLATCKQELMPIMAQKCSHDA